MQLLSLLLSLENRVSPIKSGSRSRSLVKELFIELPNERGISFDSVRASSRFYGGSGNFYSLYSH